MKRLLFAPIGAAALAGDVALTSFFTVFDVVRGDSWGSMNDGRDCRGGYVQVDVADGYLSLSWGRPEHR